jgi:hypothetical protein
LASTTALSASQEHKLQWPQNITRK